MAAAGISATVTAEAAGIERASRVSLHMTPQTIAAEVTSQLIFYLLSLSCLSFDFVLAYRCSLPITSERIPVNVSTFVARATHIDRASTAIQFATIQQRLP